MSFKRDIFFIVTTLKITVSSKRLTPLSRELLKQWPFHKLHVIQVKMTKMTGIVGEERRSMVEERSLLTASVLSVPNIEV